MERDEVGGNGDEEGPSSTAVPVARRRVRIATVVGEGLAGIFGRTRRTEGCL